MYKPVLRVHRWVKQGKGKFDMRERKNKYLMKERVSKLTYPTLQHCLRMLYTMNGNSKHETGNLTKKGT